MEAERVPNVNAHSDVRVDDVETQPAVRTTTEADIPNVLPHTRIHLILIENMLNRLYDVACYLYLCVYAACLIIASMIVLTYTLIRSILFLIVEPCSTLFIAFCTDDEPSLRVLRTNRPRSGAGIVTMFRVPNIPTSASGALFTNTATTANVENTANTANTANVKNTANVEDTANVENTANAVSDTSSDTEFESTGDRQTHQSHKGGYVRVE